MPQGFPHLALKYGAAWLQWGTEAGKLPGKVGVQLFASLAQHGVMSGLGNTLAFTEWKSAQKTNRFQRL
ncbi:hypothetical protein ABC733_00250 [Mangrovibacter sp. SLW1]